MTATAQPLKQTLVRREYRQADQQATLAYLGCTHIVPSGWIAVLESPSAEPQGNPFDAIRHDAIISSPNLRIADHDEYSIPIRRTTETREHFRGRHGKIVIIRK